MKQFNKTSAIRKIKFQKNKNTYIKRLSISLSCLILLFLVILFTFARFENSSDTYTLINGIFDEFEVCPYDIGKQWNFNYVGKDQDFKVPCSGEYKIELWGAQGGNYNSSAVGALGGYTAGNIQLDKDLYLYIYVGNKVDYSSSTANSTVFNNGLSSSGGYNGGGATDVRLVNGSWDSFNSLKSRIMVAGGGGVTSASTGSAGPGGGLNGYDSANANGTKGGTQNSFGSSTYSPVSSFGVANGGCTGGGGYYPGAGVTCVYGSGGGSSFISGYSGCNAIAKSSTASNIVHTNQPNHYSGKVFTNSVMIDGKGCNWSTGAATNCGTNQIQPNGTKAVGHSGAGYARITLISRKKIEKKINDKCLYDIGQEWHYNYTGNTQDITILCDGNYKIELWGADGGDAKTTTAATNSNFSGGKGAYTSGNINLTRKSNLFIQVGGAGTDSVWNINLGVIDGGYNGGGPTKGQYTENKRCWGTGGGATDIRLISGTINSFNSLKSRIMVAAGGGGAFAEGTMGDNGGAAGGLNGYGGTSNGYASGSLYGISYGATQTTAGYMTNYSGSNNSYNPSTKYYSKFGYATSTMSPCSAGGGGGYYGGANSGHVNSASSGSSFISGYSRCNAIAELSTESNIVHTNQPNHYSGKVFTNSVMIDGKGCNWSSGSATNCGSNQPQPNGTSAVGHSGNGYAKITYISK